MKNEDRYIRIFENLKDAIYIVSPDGKLLYINQAGLDLFGYESREEMMEIHEMDIFLNTDDRKRFLDEIIREGFVKDFELKLKRKDGSTVDVLITASVLKDDSGNIIGYEEIVRDVSQWKKILEELMQQKEELQILYDMSILINNSLDLDKVFQTALEKASNITGFEMGAVYILDEGRGLLEKRSSIGYPSDLAEKVKFLNYGEGVSGMAISLKKPIITTIEEYPSQRIGPLLEKEGIKTIIGFPLFSKGRAIGSITMMSILYRELSQWKINLLENIGNQIGLAIENAKLFYDVKKAKKEWETTFDAVTDLITIIDSEYRIIRANKATFKRLNLETDQIIGKKYFEVLFNRKTPCEDCFIKETLVEGKPLFSERRSSALNGVFHCYTFPVCDSDNKVLAVVVLSREITEEKKLEIEKEVINNINKTLAFSLDIREIVKTIYTEILKIFHFERLSITLFDEERKNFRVIASKKNYNTSEFVEGIFYPLHGTNFEKIIDSGLPVIIPDTSKCGSSIGERLIKEGIRSSLIFPLEIKGKVIGTLNFGSRELDHFSDRDLNLLWQIGPGIAISVQNSILIDEIKVSEQRYRSVVEGARDGICIIDEDYRFKFVNKRYIEIQGFTMKELIGKDFRDFLDEKSRELINNRYKEWQKGKRPSPIFELNIIKKDGEIINVEVSVKRISDSSGNLNFICFIRDITDRKRMEEQLIQTEKLRALGEMASGVAHDFNNALAAILGNIQLLLYTIEDEKIRDTLKIIEKVAKDGAQTVRRLQEFTRKRDNQELFKVNLNSVVKDAIEITKPKWKDDTQRKEISIDFTLDLGEIPPVLGNESELRESIINIILNSIEAMPNGGKICIRTFVQKKNVYVEISDTGVGMKEEVRKRIFEPFFTTKPFKNTGLGLSVTYGIIKRFGGDIEVSTKLGEGTTFRITLPIGLDGREEISKPNFVKRGNGGRILVIDDEEFVRNVLSKMLSQANYNVTVAKDGEEGLKIFKEKGFDMVLTDLGMPGLSGWEVCRGIREISPKIPIGMITGWGMELEESKINECGVDFVLSKPFDFNEVLNEVKDALERDKFNEYNENFEKVPIAKG